MRPEKASCGDTSGLRQALAERIIECETMYTNLRLTVAGWEESHLQK